MKKFRKLAVALGIGLAITAVTGMFASCKKEEPVQDVMNHGFALSHHQGRISGYVQTDDDGPQLLYRRSRLGKQ